MEKSVSGGSSEKLFIEFLVNFIVDTNPGDLLTNLEKISKYLVDEMPPKHEVNLYRKQYGNLKDCIMQSALVKQVFVLDGTCFKFRSHKDVLGCIALGILTEAAESKYRQGRESYLIKHLNLMKNNSMNECSKCEQRYHVRGNVPGNCSAAGPEGVHTAKYDFNKDPKKHP